MDLVHSDDMVDSGISRSSLSGVNELVSFLENASSSDRSAFQKRANVIFECRTCATLFRKADGFMRHVMRCDSSRGGDNTEETERRHVFATPIANVSSVKTPRVSSLKKPITNGVVQVPNNPVVHNQSPAVVKPFKKVGRPTNAERERMNAMKLAMKSAQPVEPIATAPLAAIASPNDAKMILGSAPKRAYSRAPKLIQQKVHKTEDFNFEQYKAEVAKSANSEDLDGTELDGEIRPSRQRKTPKWLEDSFVV